MSNELVKNLQHDAEQAEETFLAWPDAYKLAAARIEALEAENARQREALAWIEVRTEPLEGDTEKDVRRDMLHAHKIALRHAGADDVEYVRADLYEQAKAQSDRFCEKYLAALARAEAAERLAGARAVTVTDILREWFGSERYARDYEYLDANFSKQAEQVVTFLSALAEPAGEAEPRQFLPTEDGEFNGNTTETPIAAEDGREVDWVDVTGWGVFKGHAIPVEVARYIATKINLYAEHRTTPPAASAIREADTAAARDVLAERRRQIEAEGWTPEHDDSEHSGGQLAIAAACYAISAGADNQARHLLAKKRWTLYEGNQIVTAFYWLWSLTIKWSSDWFKPTNRRRDLIKAGALILAEIERLDRAALAGSAE